MFATKFILPHFALCIVTILLTGEKSVGDDEMFFGRGVNIGNTLEAPREGDWGRRLEDGQLATIAAAGFDSIRLPVKWSAYALAEPPYTIDAKLMNRVSGILDDATEVGLNVILNIHHYNEMDQDPDAHRERFLAIWNQIAARFADRPDSIAFEVLNEPHDALTSDKWNAVLADAVAVIRTTNPTRKILAGPVNWNNVDALDTLEFPDDQNMVMTFHYYAPFPFTHQGASWVGDQSKKWLGTRWTGTDEEKSAIGQALDKAKRWGESRGVPVYLGEFGAYQAAPAESRIRWTRFVADQAAARGIGYAYWEFYAGFGIYDPETDQWREDLRDAVLVAP